MPSTKITPTMSPRGFWHGHGSNTNGDLVKGISELIKNSDDAMNRSEQINKKLLTTPIQIFYSTSSSNRIHDIFVCDRGSGMTENQMKTWFAQIGVSGKGGKSNSFGRGAFDAMALTCEGSSPFPIYATIWSNSSVIKSVPTLLQFIGEIHPGKGGFAHTGLSLSKEFSRTHLNSLPITLDKTYKGTTVGLRLNKKPMFPYKNHTIKYFADRLEKFYLLRFVLEQRQVIIKDIKGKSRILKYKEPVLDPKFSTKSIDVSFFASNIIDPKTGKNKKIKATLTVKKSKNKIPDNHNRNYGCCFLVSTERDEILDNTIFGRGSSDGYECLFGNIKIEEWELIRKQTGGIDTLLNSDRNGLKWEEDILSNLKLKVISELDTIAASQQSKQQKTPDFSSAFKDLNRWHRGQINQNKKPRPTPNYKFSEIEYGKSPNYFINKLPQTIVLTVNTKTIPTGTKIHLTSSKNIMFTKSKTLTVPKTSNDQYQFHIPIKGKKKGKGKIHAKTPKFPKTTSIVNITTEKDLVDNIKTSPFMDWSSRPNSKVPSKSVTVKLHFNKKKTKFSDLAFTQSPSSITNTTKETLKSLKNLGEVEIILNGGRPKQKIKLKCIQKSNPSNQRDLEIPIHNPPEQKVLIKDVRPYNRDETPWSFDPRNSILYVHTKAKIIDTLFAGKFLPNYLTGNKDAIEQFCVIACNASIEVYAKDAIKNENNDDLNNITAQDYLGYIVPKIIALETQFGLPLFQDIQRIANKELKKTP